MRPIKMIVNIYVGPQLQYYPKAGSAPRKPQLLQLALRTLSDEGENICSKVEFPKISEPSVVS